jgi:ATP-dependent helicase/DNAse subunit B
MELPRPSVPAMKRGWEVHKIIETFFNDLHKNKITPAIITPDIMRRTMKIAAGPKYEEHKIPLTNLVDYEIIRYSRPNYTLPLLTEVTIETRTLKGIIDRVDYNLEDKVYEVYDYKTGNAKSIKPHIFELALYAHMFKEAFIGKFSLIDQKYYGDSPISIGIIGVDERKVFKIKLNEHHIKEALAKVEVIRKKIDDEEFEKNPEAKCYWCPYRGVCQKLEASANANR